LENIFRKNVNFEKRFPNIMRVKLEFQGGLEETLGGRREKFSWDSSALLGWPFLVSVVGFIAIGNILI
jgi:hypothetical protein